MNLRFKKGKSFFFKLLWSFLFTGIMPVVILCALILFGIGKYADSWYKKTVQKTVDSASSLIEFLIVQAAQRSQDLARNETCEQYITNQSFPSFTQPYIKSLCDEIAKSGLYIPYLIPARYDRPTISSNEVPEEYSGIKITDSSSILETIQNTYYNGQTFSVFTQPHQDGRVPLAVGIPVTDNGIVYGCIITDIMRDSFFSIYTGRIGGIQDLIITNSSGKIIFHLLEPKREGSYINFSFLKGMGIETVSHTVHDDITITVCYPRSPMQEFSNRFTSIILSVLLISLLCAVAFSFIISRSISRPISLLTQTMHKVKKGDLEVQCPLPKNKSGHAGVMQQDDIFFLIEQFNDMVRRIKNMLKEAILKQKFLQAAEIQALQSQINPHFLYNTLSSIRSMAKLQGANDAAEMVTILARILHGGISITEEMSTIGDALKLAKDYFMIESYRWPGRFNYKEQIPEEMKSFPIPKLVIQPIVENALVHGLESKAGKGLLEISAQEKDGFVIISVSDDGCGMEPEKLEALNAAINSGSFSVAKKQEGSFSSSGIALINTHRRLKLLYGAEAGLRIFSFPNEGTCVQICYKMEKK